MPYLRAGAVCVNAYSRRLDARAGWLNRACLTLPTVPLDLALLYVHVPMRGPVSAPTQYVPRTNQVAHLLRQRRPTDEAVVISRLREERDARCR
jgi:hypothetical protein